MLAVLYFEECQRAALRAARVATRAAVATPVGGKWGAPLPPSSRHAPSGENRSRPTCVSCSFARPDAVAVISSRAPTRIQPRCPDLRGGQLSPGICVHQGERELALNQTCGGRRPLPPSFPLTRLDRLPFRQVQDRSQALRPSRREIVRRSALGQATPLRSVPYGAPGWSEPRIRRAPGNYVMAFRLTVALMRDVRIEYDIDGRDHTIDVEVMTPHYRGAHAVAKPGSGFRLYFSARSVSGRSGGRTPSIIEELLRWPSTTASGRLRRRASPCLAQRRPRVPSPSRLKK